ncbi:hypothetical protein [Marinobacter fonticola]|uniref:hypothetical protein n=1 Tax=Marinobacter fonticola TaxID=2603215 RepID=UPI0011E82DBD|nr:hypothetical protein [Marinobacter fonticola]
MLSTEKDNLLTVIEILFDGEHSQFAALKDQFTEETAELVEQAMEELIKCNERMKSLVTGLVGGAKVFARGWLRQNLDKVSRALEDRRLQFDGMACRVQVAANFKRAIYMSAF